MCVDFYAKRGIIISYPQDVDYNTRKAVKTLITFNNVNAEMARNNMTVEDFTKAIGVSRRTYYSWLQTHKVPSTKLIQMAKLFHCSLNYLVGLSDK